MGEDKPADVDPSEFAPDDARTVIDAAPLIEAEAAAPTSPLDEETAPHPLWQSAEFQAGLEVGRAEGFRKGHMAGVVEGRADVRAGDVEDGIELAMEAIRATLFAAGETPATAVEIATAVKRRIRRG